MINSITEVEYKWTFAVPNTMLSTTEFRTPHKQETFPCPLSILIKGVVPYTSILHQTICVLPFIDSDYLLFANHFFINRVNLDGSGLSVVLGIDTGGAVGIEFHLA